MMRPKKSIIKSVIANGFEKINLSYFFKHFFLISWGKVCSYVKKARSLGTTMFNVSDLKLSLLNQADETWL